MRNIYWVLPIFSQATQVAHLNPLIKSDTHSVRNVQKLCLRAMKNSKVDLWTKIENQHKVATFDCCICQRPYHAEHTSSRPITEVKQHWAQSVLGWVTAWEHWVLLAFSLFMNFLSFWQTLCHLEFGSKPQTFAPKSGSFNNRGRCSSWGFQEQVNDSFCSPTWC